MAAGVLHSAPVSQAFFKSSPGDDHPLHLVGSLVNLRHLGVAQKAFHREVLRVAITAQELHRGRIVNSPIDVSDAKAFAMAPNVVSSPPRSSSTIEQAWYTSARAALVAHGHIGQNETQTLQVGDGALAECGRCFM